MLVAMITHSATRKVTKGHCRALGYRGRGEAQAAAVKLKELLVPMLESRGIGHIDALISSPATRCVETLVIVADELRDVVAVDQIKLAPELAEAKNVKGHPIPLTKKRLNKVLREAQQFSAAIVSLHGDAASALPLNWFAPGDIDNEGFFTSKPVLVIVDVNPIDGIESASLLAYENLGNRLSADSIVTTKLREELDYLSPDGSEIRLLPSMQGGGLCHCTLPQGKASAPVKHTGVEEIWFVLEGEGEVWRKSESEETVVHVRPDSCLTIPPETAFQFRSTGIGSLQLLIVTMPPWPGAQEAVKAEGVWPASAKEQEAQNPSRSGQP